MLFSHEELSAFVSATFEPVWEKVRAAPQVTVDFGDGRVVRRTLHGNVLTWVLDAEGRAIDVLPGVMTTAAYRARLEEAALLAAWTASLPEDERASRLRGAHAEQARRVAAGETPLRVERRAGGRLDAAKFEVEAPVEFVLTAPAPAEPPRQTLAADVAKRRVELPTEGLVPRAPAAAAGDALLVEDTRVNTTTRRAAAHALLAKDALTVLGPDVTRRTYSEVLGVDLDDPWLGLGEALFGSYPFAR